MGPHDPPLGSAERQFADSPLGEHEQNELYVASLRDLLADREKGEIDWIARSDPGPQPVGDDDDEFDAFVRRVSAARFARRMVDGDRAAWAEVLAEELRNEDLPFKFTFDFGVDDQTEEIALLVELPHPEIVPTRASRPLKSGGVRYRQLPVTVVRTLYEDVACALLLRMAHEVYRTIAEADVVAVKGWGHTRSRSTGQPARSVYLALNTDRDSFSQLNLDEVDPSEAFSHLGGASKKARGELRPIGLLTEDEIPSTGELV